MWQNTKFISNENNIAIETKEDKAFLNQLGLFQGIFINKIYWYNRARATNKDKFIALSNL